MKDEKKEERLNRTVNENILGLLIDDRNTSKISEAFAWKQDQFVTILHTMLSYSEFQVAAENLDHELPLSTKISSFTDFLKSNNFKRMGIKIVSPNDYFMLGFLFSASLDLMEKKNDLMMKGIKEETGMGMTPESFIAMLKMLKKQIERRT